MKAYKGMCNRAHVLTEQVAPIQRHNMTYITYIFHYLSRVLNELEEPIRYELTCIHDLHLRNKHVILM